MTKFFSSGLGQGIIIGLSMLAVTATFVLISWINARMAVARCDGDKRKLYAVFFSASRYVLFFSAEKQHKLYGISKKDMETIMKYEFYAFLEGVAVGAFFLVASYYLAQCMFFQKCA